MKVEVPADRVDTVYSVIAQRRTAFDTLIWQVPSLGLAAQAFLLTIAFGAGTSDVARCIAGALSSVVALVAIQTMLKHRLNEITDSIILREMELSLGIGIGRGTAPHDPPLDRARASGNPRVDDFPTRWRSVTLWIISLLCFATAGAVAIVLTLSGSNALGG
jgi:hypothetical protein